MGGDIGQAGEDEESLAGGAGLEDVDAHLALPDEVGSVVDHDHVPVREVADRLAGLASFAQQLDVEHFAGQVVRRELGGHGTQVNNRQLPHPRHFDHAARTGPDAKADTAGHGQELDGRVVHFWDLVGGDVHVDVHRAKRLEGLEPTGGPGA